MLMPEETRGKYRKYRKLVAIRMNKAIVKEKASERAHQDRSSPLRSMATKTGATIVAMEERTYGEGEVKGEVWGSATGKGKEDLVRRREANANVSRGSRSYDCDRLAPGAMCVRGPFISFLGLSAGSGRGPLPLLGCVLCTASQPTVAG